MFEKNGQAFYFAVGEFKNRIEKIWFKYNENYFYTLSILCGTVCI